MSGSQVICKFVDFQTLCKDTIQDIYVAEMSSTEAKSIMWIRFASDLSLLRNM